MNHLLLLVKYNFILRAKAFWSIRSGFLFLFIVLGLIFISSLKNNRPLYHFTYYIEENSFATELAIDNFTKSFEGIATIEKLNEIPQTLMGDVFLYFPTDFAGKWQSFEESSVLVTIINQSPLHQLLLKESFLTYEDILFTSESLLQSYQNFLMEQSLTENEFTTINYKLSLDFIATALNRQNLSKNIPYGVLPANLSKEYYLVGFSLFLGLLLAIYFVYEELLFYSKAKRIILASVSDNVILLSGFLVSFLYYLQITFGLYLLLSLVFGIKQEFSFYFCYPIVLVTAQQVFHFFSAFYKDKDKFLASFSGAIFFFALMGGLLLPISFLPPSWAFWMQNTPFYFLLSFLTEQTIKPANPFLFLSLVMVAGLLLLLRLTIWRKYRYV